MKTEELKQKRMTEQDNTLQAIQIVEGEIESTQQEEVNAWQHLINTGICWELQGWYGRTAYRLIEAGVCHVASER